MVQDTKKHKDWLARKVQPSGLSYSSLMSEWIFRVQRLVPHPQKLCIMCEHGLRPWAPFQKEKDCSYHIFLLTPPKGSGNICQNSFPKFRTNSEQWTFPFPRKASLPENAAASAPEHLKPSCHERDEDDHSHLWTSGNKWILKKKDNHKKTKASKPISWRS